jgi:hypothetical protein
MKPFATGVASGAPPISESGIAPANWTTGEDIGPDCSLVQAMAPAMTLLRSGASTEPPTILCAAIPVHSTVCACKIGLAFQIADDILD